MRKNLLLYVALLTVFGVGIYLLLEFGSRIDPAGTQQFGEANPSGPGKPEPGSGARDPLRVLLLQVIVIIVATKSIGALCRKAGQPAVVGEMVAGILLGPSFLGMLSPGSYAFLFPPSSMDALKLLSQVGVILFMFIVGMELDLRHVRQKLHAALLVSHASIVVPFFLGVALSLFLYRPLAPPHIPFSPFALFLGVAMSITAFPVLARIIAERGLSASHLGSTAIACAAVDDVTAWCMLATVVAIVKAEGLGGAVLTIGLALMFTGAMLFLIRPLCEHLLGDAAGREDLSRGSAAGVLTFVLVSALLTEVIGIHALFGAFLAGVILPAEAPLGRFLRERLETFSSVFLLPLFFSYTGLRTQIGLLDGWPSWLVCAGIVSVAVAGKLGGSALAARWTGLSWQDSFAIGALMNTRGLMELIVLNVGLDLGILSPRLFAMMVLMALVTTCMTGPLLGAVERRRTNEAPVAREREGAG